MQDPVVHHFHPSHGIHRCTGGPSGWGLIGEAIAACGVFILLRATTW
jgi:hypothetical protein